MALVISQFTTLLKMPLFLWFFIYEEEIEVRVPPLRLFLKNMSSMLKHTPSPPEEDQAKMTSMFFLVETFAKVPSPPISHSDMEDLHQEYSKETNTTNIYQWIHSAWTNNFKVIFSQEASSFH